MDPNVRSSTKFCRKSLTKCLLNSPHLQLRLLLKGSAAEIFFFAGAPTLILSPTATQQNLRKQENNSFDVKKAIANKSFDATAEFPLKFPIPMAGWSFVRLALLEVFTKKIHKMNLKQNPCLKISVFSCSWFSTFSKSNQYI